MSSNLMNNLRSHYRLTADKREIKDFLKLPLATSFIRKTLYEIRLGGSTTEGRFKSIEMFTV